MYPRVEAQFRDSRRVLSRKGLSGILDAEVMCKRTKIDSIG